MGGYILKRLVSVVPEVMTLLIVMSINLLGDRGRDALDPRLRSGALSRPARVARASRLRRRG